MPDDLGDALRRARSKPLRDSLERTAQRQAAIDLDMSWRGDWSPTARYSPGDAVHHSCGGFVATKANQGQEPPSGAWDVLVCKGEKGEQGERGPSGVGTVGPQGPEGPEGPPGPGSELTIEDDGIVQGTATTLNFTGNVAATVAGTEALINIAGGGTSLSEYEEDTPSADGDVGTAVLAVRNDTNADLTDTDLDYSWLAVDSAGRVKTADSQQLADILASLLAGIGVTVANFPATQPVSGTVTSNQGTSPWVVEDGHPDPQLDALTDSQLRASPVPVSGTVSVNEPVTVDGTVTANVTNPVEIEGVVADGTALTGVNPVLMAGQDGTNVQSVLTDAAGNQGTYSKVVTAALADNASNSISGPANIIGGLVEYVMRGYVFDGSTWDRMRGNSTDGLLVDLGANNDVDVQFGTGSPVTDGFSNTNTAVLQDAAGNPELPPFAIMLFNGTTWDRVRGDITNGLDVDVTRLPAVTGRTDGWNGVIKDNDGNDCTVTIAVSDANTTNGNVTLVSNVASKKIRVLWLAISTNGSLIVKFTNGAGGATLCGSFYCTTNDLNAVSASGQGDFLFETAANTALVYNTNAATARSVMVGYILVD